MTGRHLDFYFDFMSPFAYLAFHKVPGICKQYGLEFRPHVVNLPQLKLMAGNTAPPNVSLPLKIRYLSKDLNRWAEEYGLPLTFPKSLASEKLNKAFLYAMAKGEGEAFIRTAWDRVWGEGADLADPALLDELAKQFGWNPDVLSAWVSSKDATDQYEASTQAAHEAGVFGTPTMIVGDQMWWGNDRITFMERTLQQEL
ncbi:MULTISPECIES: 2-hydroxychromene-2-carboxylate isomerase [Roseobacteraceae]|uniref:2-hydroxychromene-2-carboxylate isomerase n=1 Tax=Actibacterium naphthalenivorans TaxID=1614693 RepID=A0A840CCS8_9RHOB|nr:MULTISPECIES: 2-hydroxychromene-2-carboxylate isomerase [Roseobacteraceae]MBB4023881.1 2-hydroxychromene-2-carboxylate isomerase [Actibacterium naphthalenivorans]MBN9889538.1 2-hydroxychromene-2-carboxylate isomerase [Salipiger abyssi]